MYVHVQNESPKMSYGDRQTDRQTDRQIVLHPQAVDSCSWFLPPTVVEDNHHGDEELDVGFQLRGTVLLGREEEGGGREEEGGGRKEEEGGGGGVSTQMVLTWFTCKYQCVYMHFCLFACAPSLASFPVTVYTTSFCACWKKKAGSWWRLGTRLSSRNMYPQFQPKQLSQNITENFTSTRLFLLLIMIILLLQCNSHGEKLRQDIMLYPLVNMTVSRNVFYHA